MQGLTALRPVTLYLVATLHTPAHRYQRYVISFADLLQTTPESHPDYTNLSLCLDSLNKISAEIDAIKRDQEEVHIIEELKDNIRSWGDLSPDKLGGWIFQDDFKVTNKRALFELPALRTCYLFEKYVLIVKKGSSRLFERARPRAKDWAIVEAIEVTPRIIRDVTLSAKDTDTFLISYIARDFKSKRVAFTTANDQQRTEWVNKLSAHLDVIRQSLQQEMQAANLARARIPIAHRDKDGKFVVPDRTSPPRQRPRSDVLDALGGYGTRSEPHISDPTAGSVRSPSFSSLRPDTVSTNSTPISMPLGASRLRGAANSSSGIRLSYSPPGASSLGGSSPSLRHVPAIFSTSRLSHAVSTPVLAPSTYGAPASASAAASAPAPRPTKMNSIASSLFDLASFITGGSKTQHPASMPPPQSAAGVGGGVDDSFSAATDDSYMSAPSTRVPTPPALSGLGLPPTIPPHLQPPQPLAVLTRPLVATASQIVASPAQESPDSAPALSGLRTQGLPGVGDSQHASRRPGASDDSSASTPLASTPTGPAALGRTLSRGSVPAAAVVASPVAVANSVPSPAAAAAPSVAAELLARIPTKRRSWLGGAFTKEPRQQRGGAVGHRSGGNVGGAGGHHHRRRRSSFSSLGGRNSRSSLSGEIAAMAAAGNIRLARAAAAGAAASSKAAEAARPVSSPSPTPKPASTPPTGETLHPAHAHAQTQPRPTVQIQPPPLRRTQSALSLAPLSAVSPPLSDVQPSLILSPPLSPDVSRSPSSSGPSAREFMAQRQAMRQSRAAAAAEKAAVANATAAAATASGDLAESDRLGGNGADSSIDGKSSRYPKLLDLHDSFRSSSTTASATAAVMDSPAATSFCGSSNSSRGGGGGGGGGSSSVGRGPDVDATLLASCDDDLRSLDKSRVTVVE
nr:hypothetical protein HK105_001390 [Polyrhizophydium stewartii]